MKTILIIGINTRPIVKSAKDLGFRVIAVDCFRDQFLLENSDKLFVIDDEIGLESVQEFFKLAFKLVNRFDLDMVILSSMMEHYHDKIEELEKETTVLGNRSEKLRICEQENFLFQIVDDLGIPYPETKKVDNMNRLIEVARDIGYPLLLKSSNSGGGIGIRFLRNEVELIDEYKKLSSIYEQRPFYLQEYIDGKDVSASVLSTGKKAKCLTVNEQVIGESRLDVPRKFGYCGNIIPFCGEDGKIAKVKDYSESICEELGLQGSNGVDFVVGEKPYLVEVNPRFQNTMDLVENVLGINLLEKHLEAVKGNLLTDFNLKGNGIKLVLYSKKRVKVPELGKFSNLVDVPLPGNLIEKGDPICSILFTGEKRSQVINRAYKRVEDIKNYIY